MHVDSRPKSHSRKGSLGMVQIEGPHVPFQRIGAEVQWVQVVRVRDHRVGVVVVQRSVAHRGQARWTGNSPEYFVKVVAAVAAAAAGAYDPLADYRTNRLRHHGQVVAGPSFAFASLVQNDQAVVVVAAAAADAHDPFADYRTSPPHHRDEAVAGPAFASASLVQHDQVAAAAAAAAAGAPDPLADY